MDITTPDSAIARLLALGGELIPSAPGEPRRKFDLAHMHTLLSALGSPEQRFRSVLIAGTNGKGSTAATLASILHDAGQRIVLYTSPHLERPNERIRIGGEGLSDAALTAYFEQVEATAAPLIAQGRLPYTPSFFETLTAIAFLAFAGTVDIAILEVGLGGRLDATNVVDPLVSVITDISLDHQTWLGSTVAEITREKAGILRPGGTLITLPQHPEANQTIGELAIPLDVHAVNAAEYLPGRSAEPATGTTLSRLLRNRYLLTLPSPLAGETAIEVDSPLSGGHQQRNLALAIAAAITLHRQHGFALTREAVECGIRQTVWPGRLQLLTPPSAQRHLAPVLLDAAHNPAGAWALRAALSPLPVTGPRTLIFGCMADKAMDELAQILFPVFDEVLLTEAQTPRAAPLPQLRAAAERTGTVCHVFSSSAAALGAAQLSTPAHGLIVGAGSIALLGELLSQLKNWR